MDSKADYNGTCFQKIYNKQDDFRQINDAFGSIIMYIGMCPSKDSDFGCPVLSITRSAFELFFIYLPPYTRKL